MSTDLHKASLNLCGTVVSSLGRARRWKFTNEFSKRRGLRTTAVREERINRLARRAGGIIATAPMTRNESLLRTSKDDVSASPSPDSLRRTISSCFHDWRRRSLGVSSPLLALLILLANTSPANSQTVVRVDTELGFSDCSSIAQKPYPITATLDSAQDPGPFTVTVFNSQKHEGTFDEIPHVGFSTVSATADVSTAQIQADLSAEFTACIPFTNIPRYTGSVSEELTFRAESTDPNESHTVHFEVIPQTTVSRTPEEAGPPEIDVGGGWWIEFRSIDSDVPVFEYNRGHHEGPIETIDTTPVSGTFNFTGPVGRFRLSMRSSLFAVVRVSAFWPSERHATDTLKVALSLPPGISCGSASGEFPGCSAAIDPPPAVLFLHGIMASFLYQGPGMTRVWPALFDEEVEAVGSVAFKGGELDVYNKDQDIINEFGPANVYKDFSTFMNNQKAAGIIHDWYAYAYDWRQDWRDIVNNGTIYSAQCFEPQGDIFIPNCSMCGVCLWLDDKIVELATSQGPADPGAPQPPPRKVWIVAHSNGGLLAKTLLGRLSSDVLDHVGGLILVGSPQLGTPEALGPLLHGTEPTFFLVTNRALRTAASKIPGAYQLLPTARYFDRIQDPVMKFKESQAGGSEVDLWNDHYNGKVDSYDQMREFLLGTSGPRSTLTPTVLIDWPAILDQDTFSRSQSVHAEIEGFDLQAHPFPVYQIVGSGLPTVRGLLYGSKFLRGSLLETLKTCDGDETVVVASAAALPDATTYFVNLPEHNSQRERNNSHRNMLNIEEIQSLIFRLLQGNTDSDGLDFIGSSNPLPPCEYGSLSTRSPAEIHLYREGLHTGPVQTPVIQGAYPLIEEAIPNSQYRSIGEGREALVEEMGTYQVRIEGTGIGTVTLQGGRFDQESSENVFELPAIPIRKGSRIEFVFDPTANTPPPMTMDVDGDGVPEFGLSTDGAQGTDVFLSVLRSAVVELKSHTGAADLPRPTERVLKPLLWKALRALDKVGKDRRSRRSHEARDKVGDVQLVLVRYQRHLSRDVGRGRVSKEIADPLIDEASQIESLVKTLIALNPDDNHHRGHWHRDDRHHGKHDERYGDDDHSWDKDGHHKRGSRYGRNDD